jgi:hypothetical protein
MPNLKENIKHEKLILQNLVHGDGRIYLNLG